MKEIVNIFIFRRDFRYVDNLALNELYRMYPEHSILPIFIFNPKQIHKSQNPYFSTPGVEFMIESLSNLNSHLNGALQCFYGEDTMVLSRIIREIKVNSIAFNTDFTPFAKARDARLQKWCDEHFIHCIHANDYVLFDFSIKTDSGKDYEVYTPFYKKCLSHIDEVPLPLKTFAGKFYHGKSLSQRIRNTGKFIEDITLQRDIKGGRDNALVILENIKRKMFLKYDKERDFPFLDKTTKLSAYLKFGCVSIREVFWTCVKAYGVNHGLVRELLWREFYACVTNSMGHVLEGQLHGINRPMKNKYEALEWPVNNDNFKRWTDGKTGFPIVDAAMICMNKTGYMHNRLRMIVAMFLTKDLLLDWRMGEKYFATKLVDYDPSSNSGGWQWAGSIGADAQPYFRIFNPWTQSDKFDHDCVFIKKWIPALVNVPNSSIHKWYRDHDKYHVGYPAPMLDHAVESKKALSLFTS